MRQCLLSQTKAFLEHMHESAKGRLVNTLDNERSLPLPIDIQYAVEVYLIRCFYCNDNLMQMGSMRCVFRETTGDRSARGWKVSHPGFSFCGFAASTQCKCPNRQQVLTYIYKIGVHYLIFFSDFFNNICIYGECAQFHEE
jgi:hypothetical protein